jgi:hypothetical protein
VAGSTSADGTLVPAAWFSPDLSTWAHAQAAGSGQMLAVTAAGPGFVAVGSAGGAPAVWTSHGGTAWRLITLPRPAGASGAALTAVAAVGGRMVATGYAAGAGAAPAPVTAVSANGGRSWHETSPLGGPSGVTALTAAGTGFVAVGHAGPAGSQVMVWWSRDGLTWRHGPLAAEGPHGASLQGITALSAGGGLLTGVGDAMGSAGEYPVLWRARYR